VPQLAQTSPTDAFSPSDFALVRPPQTAAREPFLPPFRAREVRDPDPLPAAVVQPRPAPSSDPLDEFLYRDDEDAPAVPGFEGAVDAATLLPEGDVREEYITFLLGAEEYAVAIERVREVLRCPPLTEVPRAPAHVRGVVSVRGEVVAVVEPRRRLGLPDAERDPAAARLLVVDVGDGPVGLLVDAVSSVVRLKPGSIEPCPQGIGGSSQEYLAGIGREGERLFTVLDLGALLRRAAPGRRRAEGPTRAG
jgi:purine-binding chemotaxis protein CheW